ncbi:MAG: DUF1178 family protein [Pseudomonadota bacterium]
MIRYTLRCSNDHRFESWFGSSEDFERLRTGGLIACAVCGTSEVEKDLMTPGVQTTTASSGESDRMPDLKAPASMAEMALSKLRKKIEATSEDVGDRFAEEARRIHEGEAPSRAIIGEARPVEAKALIEDGVPIAPLPWGRSKSN